jgi:hypothetical protein
VILGCVTAYQPYRNGPAIRSDGSGYHIWTFALKKLDFRFCEYQALCYAEPGGIPGRCVVKWPPGVALFRFPVMAWFVDVDNHKSFSNGEQWVSLIFGAGLTLAIYFLGLSILRRIKVDPLEAQVVLFMLFFGTGLFHYASGHFSISSYLNESFVWGRPMIRSVLFSYEHGLFTYYPVVLFVFAFGLARRASRTFTFALLSLVLAYATLYGFWHSWYLGGGFGHRGFVELVPLMIPVIGLGLADIHDRAIRCGILAAASVTLFIPLQVMLGYWGGSFPFERVSETDYWAHVSGEPYGVYLIAGAFVLFVVTDTLQLWVKALADREAVVRSGARSLP